MKIFNTLFLILVSSSIFLSGCLENESIDDTAKFDVNVEESELLKLRAGFAENSITLNWDKVDGAVDYRVSRELDGANPVVELTGGLTSFSFSTSAGQSYDIVVAALDAQKKIIQTSKTINVTTANSNASLKSDVGL